MKQNKKPDKTDGSIKEVDLTDDDELIASLKIISANAEGEG